VRKANEDDTLEEGARVENQHRSQRGHFAREYLSGHREIGEERKREAKAEGENRGGHHWSDSSIDLRHQIV